MRGVKWDEGHTMSEKSGPSLIECGGGELVGGSLSAPDQPHISLGAGREEAFCNSMADLGKR